MIIINFGSKFSTNKLYFKLDKRNLSSDDFINKPFELNNRAIGVTTRVEDMFEYYEIEVALYHSKISQSVNLNDEMTPNTIYFKVIY